MKHTDILLTVGAVAAAIIIYLQYTQKTDREARAQQNWEALAENSEAGKFVSDAYRPCVEAKVETMFFSYAKNDPNICRGNTVLLAQITKGETFARAVDAVILAIQLGKR